MLIRSFATSAATYAVALACTLPALAQDTESSKGRGQRMDKDRLPPEIRRVVDEQMRKVQQAAPWIQAPQAKPTRRIGIMADQIDPALRMHLDLPKNEGVQVTKVIKGGPAAKAGIKEGDIIQSVNRRMIADFSALKAAVQQAGWKGDKLAMSLIQKGKRTQVTIAFEAPKVDQTRPGRDQAKQADMDLQNQLKRMRSVLERQQRQMEALARKVEELSRQQASSRTMRPTPPNRGASPLPVPGGRPPQPGR